MLMSSAADALKNPRGLGRQSDVQHRGEMTLSNLLKNVVAKRLSATLSPRGVFPSKCRTRARPAAVVLSRGGSSGKQMIISAADAHDAERAARDQYWGLAPNTAPGVGDERLDFTNGIPERLRAVELFLETHPDGLDALCCCKLPHRRAACFLMRRVYAADIRSRAPSPQSAAAALVLGESR